MRNVIVMSGVSGSGKSTYVKNRFVRYFEVVSADDFFETSGKYKFDASKLSEAHGTCFRNFIEALQSETEFVIVDNTNTTCEEIAPYMLGAQAYGYEAEIITLREPGFLPGPSEGAHDGTLEYLALCAARNSHGVGANSIFQQHSRLQKRTLPPWWKNTDVSL